MAKEKKRKFPKYVQLALELVERYKIIRALHVCYYTQLDADVSQFATEFFYLVGDVIEGTPIDESSLKCIDMNRVRSFLKEDK
jgi:hypothetical protein